MLELKGIYKDYVAGSGTVHALRGIDLQFRKSEFVSILGPSGCGKTTLLNIIGGLDQYTEGDLVINGRSTKHFDDRDWDSYRNHSVGFVFQTYNLIPHQTVLQNVEIALTLSGVSKKIRREKAVAALEAVGLGDQLNKRPSQMSGGQMQRVAIARALVNDPDIILADEPTGALDSETSVQVMEILKDVAKDRLVVMVTHNPDLAEQYSTRIIRMLDGKMQSDTMPLTEAELAQFSEQTEQKKTETVKEKKPSMKWSTSFGLSFKNLIAKRGRTTLTSFAGSIGIIGIALIYAVSQGMNTYITTVQEDTLSSYPLTLEATTVDVSTLLETFMGKESNKAEHDLDAVYSRPIMADMINSLVKLTQDSTKNDLHSFKAYLEKEMKNPDSKLSEALTGVQYTYNMDLLVYTQDPVGNIVYSDTEQLLADALKDNMNMDMSSMMAMGNAMGGTSSSMTMPGMQMQLWNEMLSAKDGGLINPILKEQYDLIEGGRWPENKNEIVLVLNENNELDDLTIFALGLESYDSIKTNFDAILRGETIDTTQKKWTYDEIYGKEFRVILNADCYELDPATGLYVDKRDDAMKLRELYNNALTLKVVGILRPNENVSSTMLNGAIGYTKALSEYIAQANLESVAIKAQKQNPGVDIFTGLPFENSEELTSAQMKTIFQDYINAMTQEEKVEVFMDIQIALAVDQIIAPMSREDMENMVIGALGQQQGVDVTAVTNYIKSMKEEDLRNLLRENMIKMIDPRQAQEGAMVPSAELSQLVMGLQTMNAMPAEQKLAMLQQTMETLTEEQYATCYKNVVKFSDSTYDQNLRQLSDVDLDYPATINLYASSFENKDVLEDFIAGYNSSVDELKEIRYTDYVGIMMSSITTIINAITYVLISFVAISLVVSSIMIGVITLISVQERTKEIGILRAIGASKRNVSNMFNAETVMIGAASGAIGVGVTYLLCIPINAIIHYLTGIPNLSAYLPWPVALVLIGVSIFLSVFAGFIPSRSAAKKDPVVALRTE